MSYARWATNDEVVKKLEGVNLETGVKKSGIPLAYDDKYLYINNHEAHSLIIGSTGSKILISTEIQFHDFLSFTCSISISNACQSTEMTERQYIYST